MVVRHHDTTAIAEGDIEVQQHSIGVSRSARLGGAGQHQGAGAFSSLREVLTAAAEASDTWNGETDVTQYVMPLSA